MTQIKTKIPAEMEPAAVGGMVTDSKYVKDRVKNKTQEEVNADTEERVSKLEESVGTGGSVDERITIEKNRAEQAEGVLDGKVATEKQRAEGVEGGLNTRLQTVEQLAEISVGGGDIGIGTAADFESDDPEDLAKVPTVGAMLGGANDGVYDISARHSGTKYADLAVALGTDGANVPVGVRKGGMSVKFVQTSDNKYVQYRLMSDSFNTTVTNWQGVDDVPTANSENLVKSRGVFDSIIESTKVLKAKRASANGGIRLRGVKWVKVRKFDAVINPLDTSVYMVGYMMHSTPSTEAYDFEYAFCKRGKLRIWQDGYLELEIRRVDNGNITDEEIAHINASEIFIREAACERAYCETVSINNSIERGSLTNVGSDSESSLSVRLRTGLFEGKVNKGDIIDITKIIASGISVELYTFDENANFVSDIANIYGNYIVKQNGYVRLLFKKTSFSDSDITWVNNNFAIIRGVSELSDRTYIAFHNGRTANSSGDEDGNPQRLISEFVLMDNGDRVDVCLVNGSPTIKLLYMSLFDLDMNYIGEITNTDAHGFYGAYIHNSGCCYVKFIMGWSSGSTAISPTDVENKVMYTRHSSILLDNFMPFILPNTFVIGSISGTGTETSNNTRVRTSEFIPVIDELEIELLDTINYTFSLSNYSNIREFVDDITWGVNPQTLHATDYGYTRVVLRKIDDSVFTEQEVAALTNIIKVTRKSSAIDETIVPSYYQTEIGDVLTKISDNYTPNAFSYAIITDIHDDKGAIVRSISPYFSNQLKSLVDLSKKTNMLFIGILGDITTGYYGKENILNLCKQFQEIVQDAECPVFVVRGNHDDSTDAIGSTAEYDKAHWLADDAIIGMEFLTKVCLAGNPDFHVIDNITPSVDGQGRVTGYYKNTCAYYYDFTVQKVRVVVTDNQVSYPIEYQDGTNYLKYTGGQGNWRGINEKQIEWLIDEALVLPDNDWRVIILEHDLTNSKISDVGLYTNGLENYDLFNAVKAAFNSKSTSMILSGSTESDDRNEFLPQYDDNHVEIVYPAFVTNANFSNYKGKIIMESSGHCHTSTFWKDGNNIVQHNVGAAAPHMVNNFFLPPWGDAHGVSSHETTRSLGSITEALMDVVLVGPTKVNRIRFGAKAAAETKINEYSI